MRRLPLVATTLAAALLTAPSAHADEVLAGLPAASGVAAYGGDVAWWAPGRGGYRLMIHRGDQTSVAGGAAPAARMPRGLTAGPDGRGRIVFAYSRCRGADTGCRAFRYVPAAGREYPLNLPGNVTWAAQWRTRLAFVVHVPVKGRETATACDVPYAQPLGGAPRRLDRGRCGAVTSLALRGSTIATTVESAAIRDGDPRFTTQLRTQSAAGGATHVLRTANSGEESNHYGGAALTATDVYATHFGLHPSTGFVRVSLKSRRVTEVRAGVGLTGALAVDGATWAYVSPQEASDSSCAERLPCRVTLGPDPFGPSEHALPPALTQAQPTQSPRATQPYTLDGKLTSTVVRRGAVVRTQPLAGVRVTLAHVGFPTADTQTEDVQPTGLVTTTGADGGWAITIPPPIPAQPFYLPTAETPGAITSIFQFSTGAAVADITVAASPVTDGSVTLTGTVDPPQPGRRIEIKAPNGSETAKALASAPLSADGRSFTVAVPVTGPTRLVATLAYVKLGDPGSETSYSGRSRDVSVG